MGIPDFPGSHPRYSCTHPRNSCTHPRYSCTHPRNSCTHRRCRSNHEHLCSPASLAFLLEDQHLGMRAREEDTLTWSPSVFVSFPQTLSLTRRHILSHIHTYTHTHTHTYSLMHTVSLAPYLPLLLVCASTNQHTLTHTNTLLHTLLSTQNPLCAVHESAQ
jgi:hypothetical protein